MAKLWLFSAVLALALIACSDDQPSPTPTVPAAAALSESALANTTYSLERSLTFKLTNGTYTNPASRETAMLLPPRGAGDLDGDFAPDSAVLISYNGGGSGTFVYLVAVLNHSAEPDAAGAISLGDRVVVHSVDVAGRQIAVKLRTQGPGDPLCCPSLEATRVYALNGRNLSLVSKTD